MHIRFFAVLGLAAAGLSHPAFADSMHFPWSRPAAVSVAPPADTKPAEPRTGRGKVQALKPQTPAVQQVRGGGLLAFFGPRESDLQLSPETQAMDAALAERTEKKHYQIKPDFQPQSVRFHGYAAGTIVIDTEKKFLYLVESPFSARRYPIAVGREGLLFTGQTTVGDMQEWPRWIPTKEMIKREPKKYARYADGMDGGPDNPLGARAIYLYQGKRDTYIRIHGTNQPQSVGSAVSNGCFRMYNAQVMDLYRRVKLGTKVVVL